jgi:phosphoglycolate phosphatase-like HAD superfamily hydrolase
VTLLLFDVDQTLVSTGGAGIRALDRAFQKLFSIDNAMAGILPHGKTDPGIIREIFNNLPEGSIGDGIPTSFTPVLDAYLEFLQEEIDRTTGYTVLPGISNLLASLANQADILLGLATGNIEEGARIKLERGNLNQYFLFGGFGSDSENRAELVRHGAEIGSERAASRWGRKLLPHEVFVIGDTPLDIAAGRQAGFKTVGVATGKYSVEELAEAGATVAIADLELGRDQFLRTTRIE